MAQTTSMSPVVRGMLAGAVSGVIIFAVLVLMDHFVFSGRDTAQYGLGPSLIAAILMGAVFGAVVGSVVVMAGSVPAGIGIGAVLIAIVKVATVGFGAGAIIMGLIYGAIFGWAVASSAAKAVEEG